MRASSLVFAFVRFDRPPRTCLKFAWVVVGFARRQANRESRDVSPLVVQAELPQNIMAPLFKCGAALARKPQDSTQNG